jgi:hypothetical protein
MSGEPLLANTNQSSKKCCACACSPLVICRWIGYYTVMVTLLGALSYNSAKLTSSNQSMTTYQVFVDMYRENETAIVYPAINVPFNIIWLLCCFGALLFVSSIFILLEQSVCADMGVTDLVNGYFIVLLSFSMWIFAQAVGISSLYSLFQIFFSFLISWVFILKDDMNALKYIIVVMLMVLSLAQIVTCIVLTGGSHVHWIDFGFHVLSYFVTWLFLVPLKEQNQIHRFTATTVCEIVSYGLIMYNYGW